MLLAIDVGNTNTVFAVCDGHKPVNVWRCQTMAHRASDEYAAWLFQLFSMEGLQFSQISDVIVSSVVPDANFHLQRLAQDVFDCVCMVVGAADGPDLGLVINVDKPGEVGADRLVNSVAVLHDYQPPAIVVDFGTATTFDVINARGEYCGGVIAPGANLSISALHQAAAKLPRIDIKKPAQVIGRDTISAMQSGIYWGYVGLIESMLLKIEREMEARPLVIATGGLSGLFANDIQRIEKIDEDLTLRGLLHIYHRSTLQNAA